MSNRVKKALAVARRYADGGDVGRLVFDPTPLNPPKTPRQRVIEGHQEFEPGYIRGWETGGWDFGHPTVIMNMRGQQLEAYKAQEGGAIEPEEEKPPEEPAPQPAPITGTEGVPSYDPAQAPPEKPPAVMEPSLQEAQMGQGPDLDPERYGVDEHGRIIDKQTWEPVQLTPRPSVLPLTKTPEGQPEFAMPKIADIVGSMGAGWSVPVRGAEKVLGAGFTFKSRVPNSDLWDIHPEEIGFLKKVSGPKGSNPGGIMEDPDGIRYYMKVSKSLDHAKNEKLAYELYKEAGVPTANVMFSAYKGKPVTIAEMIKGKELNKFDDYSKIKELREHFPADAWLSNYDSVGLVKDNIIVDRQGLAHRVDLGGALRYRAQGMPKQWWGPKVNELESMLNPDVNATASEVFGPKLNLEEGKITAQRIANISDERIRQLVDEWGPNSTKQKEDLANNLIARRDNIAERYGVKSGSQAPPSTGGGLDDLEKAFADYKKSQLISPKTNLKPMQLNKTHSLDQIIDSLKVYNADQFPVGKGITEKQKQNINKLLHSAPTSEFMKKITSLPNYEIDNINSWLGDKPIGIKKAALTPQPKKAPDIKGIKDINEGHSVEQVVNVLKDKHSNYADIDYTDNQAGIKALNKFSAAQVYSAMQDLSLPQQDKLKSWMMPHLKGALEDFQSTMNFNVAPEFHQALKQIDWGSYKPKLQSPHEVPPEVHEKFQKKGVDLHSILSDPDWKDWISSLGFNPNFLLWKGGHFEEAKKGALYPSVIKDPIFKSDEKGFFLAHSPGIAATYAGHDFYNITPYIGRAPKAAHVDWGELMGESPGMAGSYSPSYMDKLIKAAKSQGYDAVVIDNMYDIGTHSPQTQYVFLNPNGLRAPHAILDTTKFHLSHPLAGVVGGGLFSYGMLRGQEKDESKMARGGKAQQTRKYTMPLKPGSSKKVVSQNIREFHTGPTYAHTASKFGKARADKQAIAVALSTARKYKAAGGPNLNPPGMEKMVIRGSSYKLAREGMINSSIPGRTDKLPMSVKSGSYILPADIPSALGQGNTMAGGEILKKMFSSGPYGMSPMKGGRSGAGFPRLRRRQEGGEAGEEDDQHVPIIAAGGEYIIHPDVVKDIGHGDMNAGHKVLDRFVLSVRKNNIKTLKGLKPPKK